MGGAKEIFAMKDFLSEELTASVLKWAKPALVGEWAVAVEEDRASDVKWGGIWRTPLFSFAALAATVATRGGEGQARGGKANARHTSSLWVWGPVRAQHADGGGGGCLVGDARGRPVGDD